MEALGMVTSCNFGVSLPASYFLGSSVFSVLTCQSLQSTFESCTLHIPREDRAHLEWCHSVGEMTPTLVPRKFKGSSLKIIRARGWTTELSMPHPAWLHSLIQWHPALVLLALSYFLPWDPHTCHRFHLECPSLPVRLIISTHPSELIWSISSSRNPLHPTEKMRRLFFHYTLLLFISLNMIKNKESLGELAVCYGLLTLECKLARIASYLFITIFPHWDKYLPSE